LRRFPNPAGDIEHYIRVFKSLFSEFGLENTFNNHDIKRNMIENNLATSSGYTGEEALKRSTVKDTSRDKLFNQAKMYTEIFRILGWIQSDPEKRLDYNITLLGYYIAMARNPRALTLSSLLGIAYPNRVIDVKGNYSLRPFVAILKTMYMLNGYLSRDEMIIGPLSLSDDRDQKQFIVMIDKIKALRKKGHNALEYELAKMAEERSISRTTMENYTRFPIASLKWSGWTLSTRSNIYYNKSLVYLVLSPSGRWNAKKSCYRKDFRYDEVEKLPSNIKGDFIKLAFHEMLIRGGFNLRRIYPELRKQLQHINDYGIKVKQGQILFSPFQELSSDCLNKIFQLQKVGADYENKNKVTEDTYKTKIIESKIKIFTASKHQKTILSADEKLIEYLNREYEQTKSIANTVEKIYKDYSMANQNTFYPLVANLFKIIGFDCMNPRQGVNYQRWDAIIIDSENSIPIEIKSPGEEMFISTKAVRQALENKVILLSRKAHPTMYETSSLVVGYNLPNERSDVYALIHDIRHTYNINIGIIDFKSLLHMALITLFENKIINPNSIKNLYGNIKV
jgi:hypothetical protein